MLLVRRILAVAHFIAFLSIPLFMLAILILAWFLFPKKTVLAVVFMDLDNWMFIGAIVLLLGFIPVSKKLLK